MKTDLDVNLLDYIKKENIDINLSKVSNSELWFDRPEESITVRIVIDNENQKILYDVYSIADSMHLKAKTLKDVERLEYIAEEDRKWKGAEYVENIWLIIDEISLWAQKNNYTLREEELI
jgi:hypothetical protein